MSDNPWHKSTSTAGVLLVNLGTPAAPTPKAVGQYLREFLWDPRLVDIPRPLWWLILNGIIVPFRSRSSARNYQKIWTDSGSPLLVNSQRMAAGVQEILNASHTRPVHVELAMRYGEPSISAGLQRLREQNVRELFVLPLYPQYSATTTGSVFDAVARELKTWRWIPTLHMVNEYAGEENYIAALSDSVLRHWENRSPSECLLFSFHGLPKRSLPEGDPYYCFCHKTARLVAERLGLEKHQWRLVFQSRFGREEWLQPYCDKTLQALPGEGVKSVDVICPGFAADCLETLEEINITNRRLFLQAGGESFHYIPALNDDPQHLQALVKVLKARFT